MDNNEHNEQANPPTSLITSLMSKTTTLPTDSYSPFLPASTENLESTRTEFRKILQKIASDRATGSPEELSKMNTAAFPPNTTSTTPAVMPSLPSIQMANVPISQTPSFEFPRVSSSDSGFAFSRVPSENSLNLSFHRTQSTSAPTPVSRTSSFNTFMTNSTNIPNDSTLALEQVITNLSGYKQTTERPNEEEVPFEPKSKGKGDKTKKEKIDFYSLFNEVRRMNSDVSTYEKHKDDVEFVDVPEEPKNTVFRFTEKGIMKYRLGLQGTSHIHSICNKAALCRDNYKKLREYGVVPHGDHSSQRLSYSKRFFKFLEGPPLKRQKTDGSISSPEVSHSPANTMDSQLGALIEHAEEIYLLCCGDCAFFVEEFYSLLQNKLDIGKTIKILLSDPRSASNKIYTAGAADFVTHMEHCVSLFSNFKIRLCHKPSSYCGVYIDRKLRHMFPRFAGNCCSAGVAPIVFQEKSITDKYTNNWKSLWKYSTAITSSDVISEPSLLKKLFTFQLLSQTNDNVNTIPWIQHVGMCVRTVRHQMDFFGGSLHELFHGSFGSVLLPLLKEHLEKNSGLRIRILLRNPNKQEVSDKSGSVVSILQQLRSSLSDSNLFDKKVEVRFHNRSVHFSYLRLDTILNVLFDVETPQWLNNSSGNNMELTQYWQEQDPGNWNNQRVLVDNFEKVWQENGR